MWFNRILDFESHSLEYISQKISLIDTFIKIVTIKVVLMYYSS